MTSINFPKELKNASIEHESENGEIKLSGIYLLGAIIILLVFVI